MQETILIIGDNNDTELHNNVDRLTALLPEYCVLPADIHTYKALMSTQTAYYMVVLLNVRHNASAQKIGHKQIAAVLHYIQEKDANIPVLVWGHYGMEELMRGAVELGAYDYLTKPFTQERALLSLRQACDVRRMRGRVAQLEAHIASHISHVSYGAEAMRDGAMHRLLLDHNGATKTLKAIEKDAIIVALHSAKGCVSQAARILGIGRSTLYRKIAGYDIFTQNVRDNQMTRPQMSASLAVVNGGE